MTAPRIVAFDLSLTCTGVADETGLARIRPGLADGPGRLIQIRNAVIDYPSFPAEPYQLVVIEGFSYASKGRAVIDIGGLGWVVRVALWEAGIPYVEVPPSNVKVFATGKGNASKDDVLLAAVRRLGYAGSSKDEADALWLWHMAMHAYGDPRCDVPKSHLRALDKLTWPDLTRATA